MEHAILGFAGGGLAALDWMFVAGYFALLLGLAWWVIRKDPVRHRDAVRQYFDRLCRKLEKAGIQYRSTEGAGEFMQRVATVLPAKRRELAMITGDYERLRYGNDRDERRLRRYKRAVRRFRVGSG